MLDITWVIDRQGLERYYDTQLDRPSPESYRGLGGDMYEEELRDLERVYMDTKENLERRMQRLLPGLVSSMQDFVSAYKQDVALDEKIATLHAKMGRSLEILEDMDE